MSLVAYGSSDESGDEEVIPNEESVQQTSTIIDIKQNSKNLEGLQTFEIPVDKARSTISLPTPKSEKTEKISNETNRISPPSSTSELGKINFNLLPQPKRVENVDEFIENDEDYVPPIKNTELQFEKSVKKEKAPVKISVPSLSDFKDLDKEREESRNKIKASQKGTGLFAVLPPPKSETLQKSKSLVPQVLTKKTTSANIPTKPQKIGTVESKKIRALSIQDKKNNKSSVAADYDSSSEDEENHKAPKMDFFSLSTSEEVPMPSIPIADIVNEYSKSQRTHLNNSPPMETSINDDQQCETQISDKKLVSNVINLSKEEILKKNKAEVGPKLPVPEQDYNVDSTGNVVFDEKAIEYLCGKRGVKRKNKEFEGVDIIEINGEDIKPDEREWMVKALTEEPVTRPISAGAGPSGQSKKKHQITYLAHQAKAMEVELKNQWAQNKMTRQQTQSKYGF